MSDDGELSVVIEGDDGAGSTGGSDLAELKRRAEAAEAEAACVRQENAKISARGQIENAMATVEGEARAAEIKYADCIERGDFEAAATWARKMGESEAKKLRLDEHAASVERMPVHADPVEAHLSKFTEPTARWLRDHRDWVTDPRKNAKLTGAHHFAVAEGLEPDTPEYFRAVEEKIGLRGGGNASGSRGSARRSDIDPSDIRTHIVDGGKGVFLTKGERERATDGSLVWNYGRDRGKPIGIQEMARRKAAMHAEGRYDKLG
jgi:hypothetical protein